MIKYILVMIFGLVASALLTWAVKQYALRNALLDIPNDRSSHKVSTPRGGGLAIVIVFLFLTGYLFFEESISRELFISLFVGSLLVAAVGFWDDHNSLGRRLRIAVHFFAAIWLFYWVDGLGPVTFLNEGTDLSVIGNIIGVFALVWLLNLYNFMDGIDGIAAVEAISVLGGAILILVSGGDVKLSLWLGALVVACFGFLVWNWPPARIFMGDVGSGFLGFVLGGFALITSNTTDMTVWTWLILLGVFLVDATVTLVIRVARGAKWYDAHRSHAYQHAAIKFKSHKKVTLAVLLINVVWLLPWAWLTVEMPAWGLGFTFFAYLPLVVVCLMLGAGREESVGGTFFSGFLGGAEDTK